MALNTDVVTIGIEDGRYPKLLHEIHQPPTQFFVRGNVELLSQPLLLAVVGSRRASFYGKQAVEKILAQLVRSGIPLVSGLAFGIDSIAHKLCLSHHCQTIAVLGSGLDDDSIYPRTHLKLAQEIIEQGGAVISEYPAGTPAYQYNFPERNRIIAGLCRAVVVVQAAAKSGSLITARLALESGREVGAVPGAITDPLAEGTNYLIQQGAIPILNAQDAFDLLGISKEQINQLGEVTEQTLTEQQKIILAKISSTPQHIDQIVQATSLPSPAVSITLTELELLEVVQNVGGMKYVRRQ